MKIDFASLAFGFEVKVGGGNPNWATALGQSKEYRINDDPAIDEMLKGMIYSSVPLGKVKTKIGKGGKVVAGDAEDSPMILAAVFRKVYVNDVVINDGQYILLITRDTSKHHKGRLRIKYGPSNTYTEGEEVYSNDIFFQQMRRQLGLADDSCWFVSDISVVNQNELVLKAVIVDKSGPVEYENTPALHAAWGKLEPTVVQQDYSLISFKARNRIVFGAPGTGKSHRLEVDSVDFGDNMERVTFHPNYSYAQFVGTYKPIQGDTDKDIYYKYVPGPFMRIYTAAIQHPENNYLLLIEEINRANVAAVFGDVFQLLDRKDGISEYSIATSEDIRKHLLETFYKNKKWDECTQEEQEQCLSMELPSNMFIWATMNSADQGVFPMDTAFKRRWEFEYLSVDDVEQVKAIENYYIPMCLDNTYYVKWQDLRSAINNILTSDECKINEDKLLGPFFISKNMLEDIAQTKELREKIESGQDTTTDIEKVRAKEKAFIKAFESKVIMYLFEDVMKMRPQKIFVGHEKNKGKMIFSAICDAFEKDGEKIFDLNLKHVDMNE